ncbi:MAG: hypothetical protein Q4A82_07390 [Corynebacterium sp.]|nr:hypothetical protein [Corynebacterium sp.]
MKVLTIVSFVVMFVGLIGSALFFFRPWVSCPDGTGVECPISTPAEIIPMYVCELMTFIGFIGGAVGVMMLLRSEGFGQAGVVYHRDKL